MAKRIEDLTTEEQAAFRAEIGAGEPFTPLEITEAPPEDIEAIRDALSMTSANPNSLNATVALQWIRYGTPSNGDTISFNGQTLTKVASTPGANEFSNIGELLALLNSDSDVNAYFLDSTTIAVEAAVPGTAGNTIVLDSDTFLCTEVNGVTASSNPGVLKNGRNGLVATVPKYRSNGNDAWFSPANTAAQSNWRKLQQTVSLDRESGELGNRQNQIIPSGALGFRTSPYGNIPQITLGNGSAFQGSFIGPYSEDRMVIAAADYDDNTLQNMQRIGIPLPGEFTRIGARVHVFGEIVCELADTAPDIRIGFYGENQTPFDASGFYTSNLRAISNYFHFFVDLVLEFKDSASPDYLHVDSVIDRSWYFKNSTTPVIGVGSLMSLQGTPGNLIEPCHSTDKSLNFGVVQDGGAYDPGSEDIIYSRLGWNLLV